ncbi:glycosyltransferase [Mycolicibacterium thermoresistibile]|uniref:UDP-glucuronosyltransferase n=1 Tax=Mycolicibacterium thermoresistibile TaxID=1797 RepID=A0A100XD48_MYCTH|nr:glycosyltransferase [Mycolicibacterium thermoresistibile]MCV7190405.1 glycosyltransferase [Mycolicibacterium thermoresistibile]GAT14233.1 UDP-glucuronosyltransferase [Mycolicibacterium thermoresistibile]SNW20766.1 UDP-glucuronosyltransferase [Mycolicibacterium thermoresistibile]
MKFALAAYGTRGDIEPSIAVGRELMRRGHDVKIGVPENLIGFAEAAGLSAVRYGPDVREFWDDDFLSTLMSRFFRRLWTIREPIRLVREAWEPVTAFWMDMSVELTALTEGADILFTGQIYQDLAVNVAEHYDIPLATLHYFPMRPHGRLFPMVPRRLARSAMAANDWFIWRMNKKAEDAQRSALGLPKATSSSPRRITERGTLEIQAYEKVCFPGLAAEWAALSDRRPFVGALTLDLSTDADDEVAAWIAAGPAPICFSFGSMPVNSPAELIEMLAAACDELGERALICSGWTDYGEIDRLDQVKVVKAIRFRRILPACRALVHHGGSGTLAAGLRAGLPMLIFWTAGDQPFWAAQLKRLKVGYGRRFSDLTYESLVGDLREILDPGYLGRARDLAAGTTTPDEALTTATDLLEQFAMASCRSEKG